MDGPQVIFGFGIAKDGLGNRKLRPQGPDIHASICIDRADLGILDLEVSRDA